MNINLNKRIIDILACPVCKGDVEIKNDRVVCKECGKEYFVKNGRPVMLARNVS